MSYYCFLCNEIHTDSPTEEHFIPKSIGGPKHQWLLVCDPSNTQSNSVIDNNLRDILYWKRFQETGALKRLGEALLADGTLKLVKFTYVEDSRSEKKPFFRDVFDKDTNKSIPSNNVCGIIFPIGYRPDEQETLCKGVSKISIGALVYLLKKQRVGDQTIRKILLQTSFDANLHFALNKQRAGKDFYQKFSLGRSDGKSVV